MHWPLAAVQTSLDSIGTVDEAGCCIFVLAEIAYFSTTLSAELYILTAEADCVVLGVRFATSQKVLDSEMQVAMWTQESRRCVQW